MIKDRGSSDGMARNKERWIIGELGQKEREGGGGLKKKKCADMNIGSNVTLYVDCLRGIKDSTAFRQSVAVEERKGGRGAWHEQGEAKLSHSRWAAILTMQKRGTHLATCERLHMTPPIPH